MATTITSISGLQNLPNLQNFNADWNSLQTVNLSGLTQLTTVDISDNITLDDDGSSLTSVNLSGCTALEELRLDDSDFSSGMPNLIGLTNLTWLDLDQSSISGSVDLSMLTSLTGFDLSGNSVTSVTLPESNLSNVILYDNNLTEEAVTDILEWLDGSGVEDGNVDLTGSGNAVVTSNGLTAKSNLQGKGWNVDVNEPINNNLSLTVANNGQFDIAENTNFTIEWFQYLADDTNHPRSFSFGSYFTGGASHAVSIENGTFYWWVGGAIRISAPVNITNAWHHFCIQRTGAIAKVFVDGSQIGSTTYPSAIPTDGKPLYIGSEGDDSLADALFSNFRWNSTNAMYDNSGFTVPTTDLSVESGTTLMLFQGGNLTAQLTDTSESNATITNGSGTYNRSNQSVNQFGSVRFGQAYGFVYTVSTAPTATRDCFLGNSTSYFAPEPTPAHVSVIHTNGGMNSPYLGDDTSYYAYAPASNSGLVYTANISSTIGEVLNKQVCV